jgi:hypothetical protein
MNEISTALLGPFTFGHFLALLLLALIGAALSLLLQTTNRDVHSERSPVRFSWRFFICDNSRRFATSILLILVALRFTKDLFGFEITEFWALAIGFVNDKVGQYLKDKTNFLGQKTSA